MPFDSFMTSALTDELSQRLCGLKVDKICQPERDEIDLLFRIPNRSKLIINCTASTPYMALSDQARENPAVPPMMCMLLRKHLSRAKITSVEQIGFDRIVRISFDSGDELGYFKSKYLFCEMMGRGSNLIFADDDKKILAAFRQNDLSTKFERIVMVGFPYEPMPTLDRVDPISCDRDLFLELFQALPAESRLDQFLQKRFLGFGKLTAREIVYRACGDAEGTSASVSPNALWDAFSNVIQIVRSRDFHPYLIYSSEDAMRKGESPLDFSFMDIQQFGDAVHIVSCSTASEAIEKFYLNRNAAERRRQHYNDIAQILKNCKNRLEKKISVQQLQLEEASDAEQNKLFGDLIMQEMYRIKKGDIFVEATDYSSEPYRTLRIPLDGTLSPAQNAQYYYREYTKKKTATKKMLEQIDIAREELAYADSIYSMLDHAESSADLMQIRQELSHWSYGRRLVSSLKKPQTKRDKPKPRQALSPNGFLIYVGLNNLQNDTVSTVYAEKEDLWFHVKNYHGSHVLLKAVQGREFQDEDLESAASYAAYYSEVQNSSKIEVDYTKARFIKKPNGSKPGFITYKNYTTVIVEPRPIP